MTVIVESSLLFGVVFHMGERFGRIFRKLGEKRCIQVEQGGRFFKHA